MTQEKPKTPTRKNNIKRSPSKPKRGKSNAWLILGVIVIIFSVCVAIFYAIKVDKGGKPNKSKTVYISAKEKSKKKQSKSEAEKNDIKPKKEKGSSKKEKSDSDKADGRVIPAKTSDGLLNKLIYNAKEWQPINSGLKEATKAYENIVYGGIPITKHELTILKNKVYYSAYSEKRRNPLWVAYRLDLCEKRNKLSRPSGFQTDFRTKAKVDQKTYSKAGYDKGHMCPNSAIASRYGKEAQKETFLMLNICPQKPLLNREVWERLERLEDGYANKFDSIYVITGPIFDEHVELLKKTVEIPDSFFKILVDEEKGKMRVLPFIIPQNVTGKEVLNDYLTSVDDIEKKTGLDFFAPLDDEYENKLESYIPEPTLWR